MSATATCVPTRCTHDDVWLDTIRNRCQKEANARAAATIAQFLGGITATEPTLSDCFALGSGHAPQAVIDAGQRFVEQMNTPEPAPTRRDHLRAALASLKLAVGR